MDRDDRDRGNARTIKLSTREEGKSSRLRLSDRASLYLAVASRRRVSNYHGAGARTLRTAVVVPCEGVASHRYT